jgi:hypothetical protein
MGAGHSELGNRFEYLRACFWSFYEFIPNIVAGVTRKEVVYTRTSIHTHLRFSPVVYSLSVLVLCWYLCSR